MPTFDSSFDSAFDSNGDLIIDPTAVAPAGALAPINHVAAGLARLPQQWRNSPHMIAMLAIFLARYNGLEAAYQDLLLLRSIDTANADDPDGFVGAQLDKIGAKVGQRRNGLSNDDYRRYCRAKIRANNSNGLIEDLIAIAVLVINDPVLYVQVIPQTVKAVQVTIFNIVVDDNLATILINFLRLAVAGGERLLMITTPDVRALTFTFNGIAGNQGFGTTADGNQPTLVPYGPTGASGGTLSDIRE